MSVKDYGIEISKLHLISSMLIEYQHESIPPDYWHGYFSAIAASPIILPEQSWMNVVCNNISAESISDIKDLLRNLLQGITKVLHERTFAPYFSGDANSWKTCDPSRWCEGFLTASHLWPEELQQKAGEELTMLTLPIIVFHDPEQYFIHQSPLHGEAEWEKFMEQTFHFLVPGLYELIDLWPEVIDNDDFDDGENENDEQI
ncbi:MAG: UPF0149 family protein [Salinispira sp.]